MTVRTVHMSAKKQGGMGRFRAPAAVPVAAAPFTIPEKSSAIRRIMIGVAAACAVEPALPGDIRH